MQGPLPTSIQEQAAKLEKDRDLAEQTLTGAGWEKITNQIGTSWKPPLGPKPQDITIAQLRDEVAQLKRALKDGERLESAFRSMVTLLFGPTHAFEIADVVEMVRILAGCDGNGDPLPGRTRLFDPTAMKKTEPHSLGDINGQAEAWRAVWEYCLSMDLHLSAMGKTGVDCVLTLIRSMRWRIAELEKYILREAEAAPQLKGIGRRLDSAIGRPVDSDRPPMSVGQKLEHLIQERDGFKASLQHEQGALRGLNRFICDLHESETGEQDHSPAEDLLRHLVEMLRSARKSNRQALAKARELEEKLNETERQMVEAVRTYTAGVGVAQQLQIDAERWRAMIGSARIRVLGSAGLNGDRDGYAHLGLELWTTHGDERFDNATGINWLTKYADIARGST